LLKYEFPILSKESTPSESRPESPSQGTLNRIRQFSLGRASSKSLFSPTDKAATECVDLEKQGTSTNGYHLRPLASKSVDGSCERDQRRVSFGSMPGSLPKSSGYLDVAFDESDSESPGELEEMEAGLEQSENSGGKEEDMQSTPEDELFFEDLLATGEMKNVPFL
jgi:hypothetical protein